MKKICVRCNGSGVTVDNSGIGGCSACNGRGWIDLPAAAPVPDWKRDESDESDDNSVRVDPVEEIDDVEGWFAEKVGRPDDGKPEFYTLEGAPIGWNPSEEPDDGGDGDRPRPHGDVPLGLLGLMGGVASSAPRDRDDESTELIGELVSAETRLSDAIEACDDRDERSDLLALYRKLIEHRFEYHT